MIAKIALIPTILMLGIGGYLLGIDGWTVATIGGVFGLVAVASDAVIERRRRAKTHRSEQSPEK